MGDSYRVLHFCDGDLVEETRHDSREGAEGAFALGLDHATREAAENDVDWRVELWGEDSLLSVFDSADRP